MPNNGGFRAYMRGLWMRMCGQGGAKWALSWKFSLCVMFVLGAFKWHTQRIFSLSIFIALPIHSARTRSTVRIAMQFSKHFFGTLTCSSTQTHGVSNATYRLTRRAVLFVLQSDDRKRRNECMMCVRACPFCFATIIVCSANSSVCLHRCRCSRSRLLHTLFAAIIRRNFPFGPSSNAHLKSYAYANMLLARNPIWCVYARSGIPLA